MNISTGKNGKREDCHSMIIRTIPDADIQYHSRIALSNFTFYFWLHICNLPPIQLSKLHIMKKIVRKTLKITGITLAVLIALIFLIPIIFRKQIVLLVKSEIN